jgi:hypothetical protein
VTILNRPAELTEIWDGSINGVVRNRDCEDGRMPTIKKPAETCTYNSAVWLGDSQGLIKFAPLKQASLESKLNVRY